MAIQSSEIGPWKNSSRVGGYLVWDRSGRYFMVTEKDRLEWERVFRSLAALQMRRIRAN